MSDLKKTSKKYTIKCGDIFKTEYGVLDKKNPNVLYLTGKAKVQPLDKKTTYASDIKSVKTVFDNFITSLMSSNTLFKSKYLYTLDLTENSISHTKKSNIKYTLLLMPVDIKKTGEYMNDMTTLGTDISVKLTELMSSKGFSIT